MGKRSVAALAALIMAMGCSDSSDPKEEKEYKTLGSGQQVRNNVSSEEKEQPEEKSYTNSCGEGTCGGLIQKPSEKPAEKPSKRSNSRHYNRHHNNHHHKRSNFRYN